MTRDDLITKLREYTLFVTTVTSTTELMHHYKTRQDEANTQILGEFLRDFALVNSRRYEEFDEYIQQEKISLFDDQELLPLLLKYFKAKARFNEIVGDLNSDLVLDAELIHTSLIDN